MSNDYSQQSAAPSLGQFLGAATTAAPSAPATPVNNPYLKGGSSQPAQSPYGPQQGDVRFNPNTRQPDPHSDITRQGMQDFSQSFIANQQDQNADKSGQAQIGDTIQLSDGSHYQVTEQGQQLNAQYHQSIEGHFGQGSFDAMVQFAGTLSQGEQASLERLVLSGDPASMQKAAQYVAQKMQASGQNVRPAAQPQPQYQQPQYQVPQPAYVAPTQYSSPAGLSQVEFYRELDNLKAQGIHEGHHQYHATYQNLVAARAAGKRMGR